MTPLDWVDGAAEVQAEPGCVIGYRADRGVARALQLGNRAKVRSGSVLYSGTTVGDDFSCGHNIVLREECSVGNGVSIWSNSIVDYGCTIGHRVKIHSNCYVAQFTTIEDDAFLAPGVSIANDLYPGDERSAELMRGPVIERGAQIGVGVTLLPFVRIGAGAIVGAGSVVSRDVPAGSVVYGNPARVARDVSDLTPIDERGLGDA